jgi:3-isopropylmalate/(R)-2-methylmalate dehydratase large subunit
VTEEARAKKKRRKIPTKAELLQLQKLYKTDEKIGERLGGVPAYLVAYWRRKKGIPKYSLPKFSEQEIRNLWERFGDDEKAGLELGISKAAFYNWRRRYGLREKPAFLKLEQLELNFPGTRMSPHTASLYGKRTMAAKMIARVAGVEKVERGETVEIEPDIAVVHGCAAEVVEEFKELGSEFVWNPNKIVVTLGYADSDPTRKAADDHQLVRDFSRRQSIKNFYDLNEGICQQVVIEHGHVLPGQVVLGIAQQATAYGCLGAFAYGTDPEHAARVWVSGRCDVTVPDTVRIIVGGRRYRGVYASDVVLSVSEKVGPEVVGGKVIEFSGSVVSQMTISERLTLSSYAARMGALAAICPYDATTRRYLTGRTSSRATPVIPDKDAEYDGIYQVNVDQLTPLVARNGDAQKVQPAVELEGAQVNQVILGSCASGRFDELRIGAEVLKGKHVHPDCRLIVVPGSRTVYLEALKKGLIRVFIEAGAIVMSPATCPYQSTRVGELASGERCLTTNSSHVGQPENGNAEIYLCSPATAAASALNGVLTDPTRYVK